MEKETIRQFRLGIFVLSGTILLILSMYFIGRNQHLFGSTIQLESYFRNVNGLQPGNDVRFAGSDAGTVESVEIMNDSVVRVTLVLDKKYERFVRKDAIASIGTDGLMGNKIINIINTPNSHAPMVSEGDAILSRNPIETDEALRTLNYTNEQVAGIAYNLKTMTNDWVSSRGALWKLLTDTTLSHHIDTIFENLNTSSQRLADLSGQLDHMVKNTQGGKGLLGLLVADTTTAQQFHAIVSSLSSTSQQTSRIASDLQRFSTDIDRGKGTVGMLLRDSTLAENLRASVNSLKQGAEKLNQSMEALKNVPLLKRYLKEDATTKTKK